MPMRAASQPIRAHTNTKFRLPAPEETSLMIMLLLAVLALGFPPLAMWARRTGGAPRLLLLACGALAGVIALAFAEASRGFGNRLVDQEGYWSLAPRTAVFDLLTAGLPVVAIALVVEFLSRRGRHSGLIYGTSVLAALVAFALGVTVAMSLFWR